MEFEFEDNSESFKAHITIQQRNTKKYITNVSGIPDKYDLPKILKYIKKIYKCGGTVLRDDNQNQVLQLSGDQRNNIYKFFIDYNVMDKENIILHGF